MRDEPFMELENNILTVVTRNNIISIKDFTNEIYVNVIYDRFESSDILDDDKEIEKEFTNIKDTFRFIEEYLY